MISVRNAKKQFGAVSALDDVSIEIKAGERVALVGSNGSGKSTLLRAICGLVRISGAIAIDGVNVATQPELALRSLAYMPQLSPPLEAPVEELVRAYSSLRGSSRERCAEYADRLGLSLTSIARTRARDLSGGMKQKLLAALSLASEAPILVCDEPTASLDSAARAAFFALVKARPASSTLLLCSHRLDEVRELVDRVLELKEGRVAHESLVRDTLLHLPTCCIEICFSARAREQEADLVMLAAWGFQRLEEGRFRGYYCQADKLQLVSRVLERYQSRLCDLQVVDSESLPSSVAPSVRRAS